MSEAFEKFKKAIEDTVNTEEVDLSGPLEVLKEYMSSQEKLLEDTNKKLRETQKENLHLAMTGNFKKYTAQDALVDMFGLEVKK